MVRDTTNLISRKAVRCADSQEDVRRERTRSRLTAVVMQLARSGEINITTVTTVARRAAFIERHFIPMLRSYGVPDKDLREDLIRFAIRL